MAHKKSSGENIFQKIFSSLFGSDDPEREKKRKLKAIAKRLSKSHYKFYKVGSAEVLPAFAKLMYDIYKAVSPVQTLFQSVQNPNAIKTSVIEYFLSDEQKKLEEALTKEAITEQNNSMTVNQVVAETKRKLDLFIGDFTSERVSEIERRYKELIIFKDFCSFDFYFILKKFNTSLVEHQFSSTPVFTKITGKYIADDLKDFSTVIYNLTEVTDWAPMMKMLKSLRGFDLVPLGVWKKIVSRLQNIQSSFVFDMMVQLITENPDYKVSVTSVQSNIVDQFINKIKVEITSSLRKLESAETTDKVNSLLVKLFNTTSLTYLKNYISENSVVLEKKKMHGYTYCNALNYLKCFLIEFVKTDIREYCELVLIRGKWTANSLSSPMSNAYNDLLAVSDAITNFDNTLAEDGKVGAKIKTLIPRTQHDNDASAIINRLVNDSNAQAKTFITDSTRNLITIGKMIKNLIEDEEKKSPELLINWKEIARFADPSPKEVGIEAYKKIYLFATLMKICMTS